MTDFTNQFEAEPGFITGKISGVGPSFSVSGSFSTSFCVPMLGVTI